MTALCAVKSPKFLDLLALNLDEAAALETATHPISQHPEWDLGFGAPE